jgi:hypothetical protein
MSEIAQSAEPVAARMEVLAHEAGNWYLLSDADNFYLDIRTGLIGQGFWLLLNLNEEERNAYRTGDIVYVTALAKTVQLHARTYFLRNEPIDKQRIVFAVVEEWQKNPRRHEPQP